MTANSSSLSALRSPERGGPPVAMRPALIGVPFDAGSSYLRGAALAPRTVREALRSRATPGGPERVVRNPGADIPDDLGDLELPPDDRAYAVIEQAVADLARQARPFIAIGGDHSMTCAVVRGLSHVYRPPTILCLDAHPGLYDECSGNRLSHLCPFARIMEEGLASRLVQVGVRVQTPDQRAQARRFDVEQIEMRSWADGARPATVGQVYLSIDLDAFDPAFAPGVSHREPGGLSVREVLTLLDTIGGDIVAAEIVEFNPTQDIGGLTAALTVKLVREIAARMVAEGDS